MAMGEFVKIYLLQRKIEIGIIYVLLLFNFLVGFFLRVKYILLCPAQKIFHNDFTSSKLSHLPQKTIPDKTIPEVELFHQCYHGTHSNYPSKMNIFIRFTKQHFDWDGILFVRRCEFIQILYYTQYQRLSQHISSISESSKMK